MNYPTDELIEYALSFYDSDVNHYHTKYHALEMLTAMDAVFAEADDKDDLMVGPPSFGKVDRMLLKTAALFHDAGYIPGAKKNEQRAVDIACPAMIKRGWTSTEVERLRLLILSTIPFQLDKYVNESPELAQHMYLLHDLDWIGFSNWEVMMANETKIIREAQDRCDRRLSYEECLKAQSAFYKRIVDTSKDESSVIGKGFYRHPRYEGMSEEALDNVESRLYDIELDEQLDKLGKKLKDADTASQKPVADVLDSVLYQRGPEDEKSV